jgi:hypothetical protein
VNLQPLVANDSLQLLPDLGWINVPRTKSLLFDVYHSDMAGRARPRGWVDRPSEGILVTYALMYQSLARVLQAKDPQGATKALVDMAAICRSTTFSCSPGGEIR